MAVKEAPSFVKPELWYTFSILIVAALTGQTSGQTTCVLSSSG